MIYQYAKSAGEIWPIPAEISVVPKPPSISKVHSLAGWAHRVDVENPSDGTIFATVKGASAAQVESAIRAAWQARRNGIWSGRPAADRAAALFRMIAWLADNKDAIEDILMAEAGVVRASLVRAGQLDAAIQHATDFIELFLTLPEIEENPLPLRDRFKGASAIPRERLPYKVFGAANP